MASPGGSKEPAPKKTKLSKGKSPQKLALQASLNAPVDFSGIKKISELCLNSQRCSFHGRLVFMRLCQSKSTSKVALKYLSMVFLDGSGEIKGIAWRDLATDWSSRLTLNEVYTISNFQIRGCDARFSRVVPGNLQVVLEKYVKIEPVKWAKGMTADTFPRLNWNIKSLAEVSAMDFGNCPVVDIIGLVINYSFDKFSEKPSDLGDGVIDDGSTDMQVVLRNEVEGQHIIVGKLEFFKSELTDENLKKGKTVIRLKGVKIVKQDFPLKGDVFQDSMIEINPSPTNIPIAFRNWMALAIDSDDSKSEGENSADEEKEGK